VCLKRKKAEESKKNNELCVIAWIGGVVGGGWQMLRGGDAYKFDIYVNGWRIGSQG